MPLARALFQRFYSIWVGGVSASVEVGPLTSWPAPGRRAGVFSFPFPLICAAPCFSGIPTCFAAVTPLSGPAALCPSFGATGSAACSLPLPHRRSPVALGGEAAAAPFRSLSVVTRRVAVPTRRAANGPLCVHNRPHCICVDIYFTPFYRPQALLQGAVLLLFSRARMGRTLYWRCAVVAWLLLHGLVWDGSPPLWLVQS